MKKTNLTLNANIVVVRVIVIIQTAGNVIMPARCGQDWFKHQGLSTTDLGVFLSLKEVMVEDTQFEFYLISF